MQLSHTVVFEKGKLTTLNRSEPFLFAGYEWVIILDNNGVFLELTAENIDGPVTVEFSFLAPDFNIEKKCKSQILRPGNNWGFLKFLNCTSVVDKLVIQVHLRLLSLPSKKYLCHQIEELTKRLDDLEYLMESRVMALVNYYECKQLLKKK